MKYIKKFIESFESNSSEVVHTCENLLLDLTDKGLKVSIYDQLRSFREKKEEALQA